MKASPKTPNSSTQPYTNGSCLILKRVRFANGRLYDVRIRKFTENREEIAFGEMTASTVLKVRAAVAEMFKAISDPNPVSIHYESAPEACFLINKKYSAPIDVLGNAHHEVNRSLLNQARTIYEYLLPQTRTFVSLDPKAQWVKKPIHISAQEAAKWDRREAHSTEASHPSPTERDAFTPVTKTEPLPEFKGQETAFERVEASSSEKENLYQLLFRLLDAVPLNYKGQDIKYTEVCYYLMPLDSHKRKMHPFGSFSEALQKVFANPNGNDEKEIRNWILNLYKTAYRYYLTYTKYTEQECREHAARVVVTFSSGVDINRYLEKLMNHESLTSFEGNLPPDGSGEESAKDAGSMDHDVELEPKVGREKMDQISPKLYAGRPGIRIGSTDVLIESGDITKTREVEAIVNAANTRCLGGTGVDGAIHEAAGKELLRECEKLPADGRGNRCPTGGAVITRSGKLAAQGIKYVIHAVGPDCREIRNPQKEKDLLKQTYLNALNLAHSNGIRSVAFPAISAGVYGYPFEAAAQVALETIEEYSKQYPGRFTRIKLIFRPGEDFSRAESVFNSIYSRK